MLTKKMKVLIAVLICSLTLFGCSEKLIAESENNEIPDTVMLRIYYDGTSSGGNRISDYFLVFNEKNLASGTFTYDFDGTDMETTHIECVVDLNTMSWVDKQSGEVCDYDTSNIPLDLDSIKEKIGSEEIKPSEVCMRFETCFSIINS